MGEISRVGGCWKKIGVHGDSSCGLLREHVHCRNCPVYSEAAVRLLDSELPDDALGDWSQSFARAEHLETRGSLSIVVFRVGSEWLALPTTAFQEIATVRAIHPVPHRRNGVILGLANVRGELIVCASLHCALGLEPVAVASRRGLLEKCGAEARFLVLQHDAHRIVCPADEVYGVERIHTDRLEVPPDTVGRAAASYARAVLAWQERSLNLLDAKRLFSSFDRSMSSVKTI
jgi:chemotaxis-related protein WspD